MEFDWASYGLGVVTGVFGVAAALAGLGFWAWAMNKRGLDAQDIDNQMEEAKYIDDHVKPWHAEDRNRQRELCISNGPHDAGYHIEDCPDSPTTLPAVPDNLTSSLTNRSAPVPQLGYVDHHRTRRRRTG